MTPINFIFKDLILRIKYNIFRGSFKLGKKLSCSNHFYFIVINSNIFLVVVLLVSPQ